MVLENIIIHILTKVDIMLLAEVVIPVNTSLEVIIIMTIRVVAFVLQVNTAGTCPPLLLALRLLLQLIC